MNTPRKTSLNSRGFRWNAELDIRSIKSNLNLKHVRCKSPEMVRRQLWTTILAYNLIRSTAASAAILHGKKPRQISFTSTCQFVLSSWSLIANGSVETSKLVGFILHKLKEIAACIVGNRPGRIEPRVIKRRRDNAYPLMKKNESRTLSRTQETMHMRRDRQSACHRF